MFSTVGGPRRGPQPAPRPCGRGEIDDLISELSIVAAALGIVQAQREAAAEAKQLAA